MLIGGTGVGKSSFINFLGGSDSMVKVSTDPTKSCTKGITKIRLDALDLNIFDTPGLGDLEELSDTMIFSQFIQEICTNTENKSVDGIILL